jgi:hypothetical protein
VAAVMVEEDRSVDRALFTIMLNGGCTAEAAAARELIPDCR